MVRSIFCLLLALLPVLPAVADAAKTDVQRKKATTTVTLLANAGVRVEVSTVGEKPARTALFDAFVQEPYAGYGGLGEERFGELLDGGPVQVAVTTHVHADHFQAGPAREFLELHPETLFCSTPQVTAALLESNAEDDEEDALAERVRALELDPEKRAEAGQDDVRVEAFPLSHGGRFAKTIENLGIIVELSGFRILHVGDADGLAPNYTPHTLAEERIDLALVPFWYFGSETGRKIVTEQIKARHLLAVHIQPGREDSIRQVVAELPFEVMVLDPGESRELALETGESKKTRR